MIGGHGRGVLDRLRALKRRLRPIRVTPTEDGSVQILSGVKLFRDVRIGTTTYRGSGDSLLRPADYIFDALPDGALAGRSVLDLGCAGGAIVFGAVERGAAQATGLEIAEPRIRGAEAIQRLARASAVRFVRQDFFSFLRGRSPEFDVVFVLNVLHHLGNPFPLVRRICRSSREWIVVETPERVDPGDFSEYSPDALQIEGARPARTPDDLVRFFRISGFTLQSHRPPASDVAFVRGDEVKRSLYVFGRESHPGIWQERLDDLAAYREPRAESYRRAKSDERSIELRPGAALVDILRCEFRGEWTDAMVNFLILGPRASGKTYWYDQLGSERHPNYNPKIFKFPNDGGRHGLRRHLNPSRGHGGTFAQVLISTADDESAHCTREQLGAAVARRPVVCLLLNVSFDEHVRRLYERERSQADAAWAEYDVSLRFDCTLFIDELKRRDAPYRVLTISA